MSLIRQIGKLRFLKLVILCFCSSISLISCSVFSELQEGDSVTNSGVDANVTFVRAIHEGSDLWTFHVTIEHPDVGWEDYADGWDVVLPDGSVILPDSSSPFTRLLLHPHETEQPFTRSQSGIRIPDSVSEVTVRAHDLVDGFGGNEVVVDLTTASGPNFEVDR